MILGDNSCLNFWDEAWWFISLRVFGLLSSSLLLFPQRFGRYLLRPSSGVCRTREPSRNFELRPLLNPRGSPVRIPLAITGYKCEVFQYCYSPAVRIEPATSRWLSPKKLREPTPITVTLCVLLGDNNYFLILAMAQARSLRCRVRIIHANNGLLIQLANHYTTLGALCNNMLITKDFTLFIPIFWLLKSHKVTSYVNY